MSVIPTGNEPRLDWRDHIVATPGTLSGRPRIKNTRIRVLDILQYMAGGDSIEDLIEGFPQLTRDDIRACLAYAAEQLEMPAYALAAEWSSLSADIFRTSWRASF